MTCTLARSMLPIGLLFAFIARYIGRLLQVAFNWATLMLFGQIGKDKQIFVSLMALLALIWPIALAGILVPSLGAFLLAFVIVPDWLDVWVRLAMFALAVVAPLGVGYLAIRLREDSLHGVEFVRALFNGYPNALALSVVLLWLMIATPVMKLRDVLRRYESAHVPISIKPGGYEGVVSDIAVALERSGLAPQRRYAPWPLAVPGRILGLVSGAGVRALVPRRLWQLTGNEFVVTVHPMDVTLSGKRRVLADARAALVQSLTFTQAYQTRTKESHAIEDALREASRGEADLDAIGARLEELDIPYEEWETLYRMLLQVRLRRARSAGGDGVRQDRRSSSQDGDPVVSAPAPLPPRP